MTLEDIDGDVYASDALLDILAIAESNQVPSYVVKIAGKTIGKAKSFKFSNRKLRLTFSSIVNPYDLLKHAIVGDEVMIDGIKLPNIFCLSSVKCDIENGFCVVKAISGQ